MSEFHNPVKKELSDRSKEIRLQAYRLSKANGGYHYGGSFSCAEILLALYDPPLLEINTHSQVDDTWNLIKDDDRFILSKGHGCWVYYAILQEQGYQPKLGGHPLRDVANGVHWTTGSEGHGFPAAVGMAQAKKMLGKSGRVIVLMGDGECQEGTTWESLMLAIKFGLNNLIVIVDSNRIQGSGRVSEILPIHGLWPAADALGWRVTTLDGHNVDELREEISFKSEAPHMIVANTIKGRGVKFMEDNPEWHAKYPNREYEEYLVHNLTDDDYHDTSI